MATSTQPAVLLDLDGTLVDSVFLHVVTWGEALHSAGYDVPLWRVHRGIGMGSDRIVPWLVGGHVDDAEALSDGHKERFLARADTLQPTAGALELLDDLERRKVPFLIATSAGSETRAALLDALGRDDLPTADNDDVESSKPAADLLLSACESLAVEASDATLVGDSPWDAEAARRIGMRAIAVRCGGFSESLLREFGAMTIVNDPRELIGRL